MEGTHIMGNSNGNFGYTWGVPPIFIQNDVDLALLSGLTQFYPGLINQNSFGMGTTVTVEGFGSIQETPKYVYTIVFNANIPTAINPSLGYGYYPLFSALGDGEVYIHELLYIYVYDYIYKYIYMYLYKYFITSFTIFFLTSIVSHYKFRSYYSMNITYIYLCQY